MTDYRDVVEIFEWVDTDPPTTTDAIWDALERGERVRVLRNGEVIGYLGGDPVRAGNEIYAQIIPPMGTAAHLPPRRRPDHREGPVRDAPRM